ncbi:hypothetical protein [Halomonas elongata]|uniref:NLPC domain protein n=1 Tax=Halomonas elongata (strain ATCC 33173 / DSM 2581 / NBRC 15536 / NCIMB 2198 / 1H9) TaxID=768066 RepID=E1VAA9_HALED|nr:hypothetical protein [Halomonas elongata]WBF19199.1 hypothetical protein LM502_05790 [Halomonas elongata]WPU48059.1 hypothetical protein SR933_04015 [Halomonas elongata DSM 2581]CBV41955.1 NLPC domain protein [Halomonas elongata DSM 2581]
MTDAEAITLLQNLAAEAQAEQDALTNARSDFEAAKLALNNAMMDVSGQLADMRRHVRYAIDFFGV